jgi:hypothetical protein
VRRTPTSVTMLVAAVLLVTTLAATALAVSMAGASTSVDAHAQLDLRN